MSPAEDDAPDAWWVSLMNEGLDSDPGWTLVAFFICDLGSAMVLFALYTVAQVNVDADSCSPTRSPRDRSALAQAGARRGGGGGHDQAVATAGAREGDVAHQRGRRRPREV